MPRKMIFTLQGASAAPMIKSKVKAALRSETAHNRIGDLAGSLLRVVNATARWQIDADPLFDALAAGEPCIVAFWHEVLPSMPALWLAAKARGIERKGYVLVSRHRDGQLIGRAIRCFGVGLVSGSTSRGGASGLRELSRLVITGHPVAITPDGPRGPRRVAAPGIAQLAALTGAQIFCIGAATRRAFTFARSWDQMRIPMPFSIGAITVSPPIRVDRQAWETSLPEIESSLSQALKRATERCQ